MADRTIAIAFAPANSFISIHTAALEWKTKRADDVGYAPFQIDDSLGDSDIRIEAEGYDTYQVHFKFKNVRDNPNQGVLNQQVNVGEDIPALIKLKPEAKQIKVVGKNFVDESGKRIVYTGCDLFCGLRDLIENRNIDEQLDEISSIFKKSKSHGLVRTFMQGSIRQNQVMELNPKNIPNYFNWVHKYAEKVNSYDLVLLAEIFVDNQDIQLGLNHWNQFGSVLRDHNAIQSGGNEWDKNGFNPQELFDPGLVWSRGSATSDVKTPPNGAPCNSFHNRRDYPKYLTDSVASPVDIYEHYGNNVILMDEPIKFADYASFDGIHQSGQLNDPNLSFAISSAYRGMVGAAVFHNYYSQRGLLLSAHVKECFEAWCEGMKL